MILGNHFSFVASNTLSINNDQIKKSIETTNLVKYSKIEYFFKLKFILLFRLF